MDGFSVGAQEGFYLRALVLEKALGGSQGQVHERNFVLGQIR